MQLTDFSRDPFIVFYEVTRACDLACRHCRASAKCVPQPGELSHDDAIALVDRIAAFESKPIIVFTGGDPLKREDLVSLVERAKSQGLKPSLAPAATPRLQIDGLNPLKDAGIERVAVSLDGPDAESHEAMRRIPGSFEESLRACRAVREAGLGLQVNTTVTRHNITRLPELINTIEMLGVGLWSVFFLVPVGRAASDDRIEARQYEAVFALLHEASKNRPFAIKTTEAPFYRRFVLQRGGQPQKGPARGPLGINDGKGVMFIAHDGVIQPSGFLPVECGRFPSDDPVKVYRENPIFQSLRDPDQLKGKCGVCDYRQACGGSRARAFALTGDVLAEEPDCVYQPGETVSLSVTVNPNGT